MTFPTTIHTQHRNQVWCERMKSKLLEHWYTLPPSLRGATEKWFNLLALRMYINCETVWEKAKKQENQRTLKKKENKIKAATMKNQLSNPFFVLRTPNLSVCTLFHFSDLDKLHWFPWRTCWFNIRKGNTNAHTPFIQSPTVKLESSIKKRRERRGLMRFFGFAFEWWTCVCMCSPIRSSSKFNEQFSDSPFSLTFLFFYTFFCFANEEATVVVVRVKLKAWSRHWCCYRINVHLLLLTIKKCL
jgi:hypothetical protein